MIYYSIYILYSSYILIENRPQHFKYLGFSKCSDACPVYPLAALNRVCVAHSQTETLTTSAAGSQVCTNPIIYATSAWVRLGHTEDTVEL